MCYYTPPEYFELGYSLCKLGLVSLLIIGAAFLVRRLVKKCPFEVFMKTRPEGFSDCTSAAPTLSYPQEVKPCASKCKYCEDVVPKVRNIQMSLVVRNVNRDLVNKLALRLYQISSFTTIYREEMDALVNLRTKQVDPTDLALCYRIRKDKRNQTSLLSTAAPGH